MALRGWGSLCPRRRHGVPRSSLVLGGAVLLGRVSSASSSTPAAERDGGVCSEVHGSPCDIVPHEVVGADSIEAVRLRYATWELQDLTRIVSGSSREKPFVGGLVAFDVANRSEFYMQVGSAYHDFDQYSLRQIQVHSPSQHTFLGRRLPLEVQLWHEPFDKNFRSGIRTTQQEIEKNLVLLKKTLAEYAEKVRIVSAGNERNISLPSMEMERDLKTFKRHKVELVGKELLKKVESLWLSIQALELTLRGLVDRINRPQFARLAVLSMLFRSSDASTPPQAKASQFVRWLADVVEGDSSSTSSTPEDGARRNTFDFRRLPYQSTKDVKEAAVRQVFSYEGSFTQPPCTPVVNWFVGSEPLVAHGGEVLRLLNLSVEAKFKDSGSKGNMTKLVEGIGAKSVWWSGSVQDTEQAVPSLPRRVLQVSQLSVDFFTPPHEGFNRESFERLSWSWVSIYCGTFLFTSTGMLCTALGICAKQICDQ
eukprot:TRINITY_DN22096_c1_g3_i2.p1 TRINITY_DN22096_c1_g3~~TRINITY_DN22096_c1_g3_i2.p1  ORF type:complete len:499 (-),score=80.73 TRINITY_DN22096_c1_g3_i2:56-1495(-)